MRPLPVLVIGALSACSYPQPTPLAQPQEFVIAAPMDSVFEASLGTLVKWNFVVTYADKTSGVITTAAREVTSGDDIGRVLYPATNCSPRPTGFLGTIDSYRVQLSIALQDEGGSTSFRISTGIRASWLDILDHDADDRLPTTVCTSAGPFERTLAQEIWLRLGR